MKSRVICDVTNHSSYSFKNTTESQITSFGLGPYDAGFHATAALPESSTLSAHEAHASSLHLEDKKRIKSHGSTLAIQHCAAAVCSLLLSGDRWRCSQHEQELASPGQAADSLERRGRRKREEEEEEAKAGGKERDPPFTLTLCLGVECTV